MESGQKAPDARRGADRSEHTPPDTKEAHEISDGLEQEAPREAEPLRKISEEELRTILELHEAWLDSEGGSEEGRADLSRTDLQGAILAGAQLQGAILAGAQLQGATLTDADLDGVKGIQARQLRGSDLSNARLPQHISKFEALKTVEQASQSAGKLFVGLLAACVYCWLTIAMTTDAALISNSVSSPLPIIGTSLPIVSFFWVAPLILLALYVYFQLQLQRLWEELAELPAVFPDGKPLDKKVYPWLPSGLVRAHFTHLRRNQPPFFPLQKWITILVAWWVVPMTLGYFALKYLVTHDEQVLFHLLLVAISVWLAAAFYRTAAATLKGTRRSRYTWKNAPKDVRTWAGAAVVLGVIVGWHFLLSSPAVLPRAELREADFSGADLEGVRLEYANLTFSRLDSANLEGAQLQGAILHGANLWRAQLQGANLEGVQLQGAFLVRANFQGAKYLTVEQVLGARGWQLAQLDEELEAAAFAAFAAKEKQSEDPPP